MPGIGSMSRRALYWFIATHEDQLRRPDVSILEKISERLWLFSGSAQTLRSSGGLISLSYGGYTLAWTPIRDDLFPFWMGDEIITSIRRKDVFILLLKMQISQRCF